MSESEHRPMFSQVGRPRGVATSRGSRLLLLLIAFGLTAAILAQLWVIEVRGRVTTVRVWLSVTPESEAAAEAVPDGGAAPEAGDRAP